ncbi:MAG TPA: rod shape-determining protein RodA [Acidimicrobiales bacterium]|jgi:rod shape determining protein RodA|nr:rod shape-determining protein RodA [Acidimicrobiales bacterium]
MAVSAIPRHVPRSAASTLRRNPTAAWRHLDLVLVGCVVAVSTLGLLMVYTATRGPLPPYNTTFLVKQALFVVLGLVVMALVVVTDYRHFRDWAIFAYIGACSLLLLVKTPLGLKSKGAQSWFQVGTFTVEPSEFMKLALILSIAAVAAQFYGEIDRRRLIIMVVAAGFPLFLIMMQPDLGTALVLSVITAGVFLVAGVQAKHLAALMLVTVLGATFALNSSFLAQYQKDRLTSFTHQDQGLTKETYNINQSKTAIGAGALTGEGIGQGSQTRLGNVPEQHTDFIFTAVGEQLGFLGAATLLSLFSIIAWRIWRTAQLARDEFGMLVCVGVLAFLMFQIFENVGMTMGIMPVTGIPLPLVSYGGSSTLAEFFALGLVLNVHMRRFA